MADSSSGQLWAISPTKVVAVVRRYFARLERRRALAMRECDPGRQGLLVDAKLVWMSVPVVAALLIAGHLLSRREGRRGGGDEGGKASSRNSANRGKGDPPLNLEQLRALRAEAAEARLPKGSSKTAPPLTPLSSIRSLARKVDKLEEECSALFSSVGTSTTLLPAQQKELAQFLELLTQVQLKLDGVKGDETVRSHRKAQTTRVQALLLALEKLASESSK